MSKRGEIKAKNIFPLFFLALVRKSKLFLTSARKWKIGDVARARKIGFSCTR